MLRAWILAAFAFHLAAHDGQGLEAFRQPRGQIQPRAEPRPADPETLAWIKGNAIPLKGVVAGEGFVDMQPLKALIGDATVVGLGEATHGTREFFQLKHRMLEFLVSEMGFTVFAIEANLPEAFRVNEYVLTGKGDPVEVLAGLHFWTWNTEEVLDLIRWMRAYNADPQHTKKLSFYGVDMLSGREALAQAKAWLENVDPAEAVRLTAIGAPLPKLPRKDQGPLTEEGRQAWGLFGREIEALIARLEARRLTGEDFDRQRQNLRVLAQLAAYQADPGGYAVRDAAMASNLQWIQAREGGAKVVLWAHNGHITQRRGAIAGANGMGWHLRQSLGAAYRPIGFAFREGGFQAMNQNRLQAFEVKPHGKCTLDAALAATGHPVLALDLRKHPVKGPVGHWLKSPQGTWCIESTFTPWKAWACILEVPIIEDYDALLFVNRTTSARPILMNRRFEWPKEPVNLDFRNGLEGWSQPRGNSEGYAARIVHSGGKEGTPCLQVTFEGASRPELVWWAVQTVDATAYRGKKVRLSGRIRTDGKPASKAVLWLRVNCRSGKDFLDNMKDRPVTGTAWTEVALEGPVADDAVILDLGCKVLGNGTAWFDGIRVEVLP